MDQVLSRNSAISRRLPDSLSAACWASYLPLSKRAQRFRVASAHGTSVQPFQQGRQGEQCESTTRARCFALLLASLTTGENARGGMDLTDA